MRAMPFLWRVERLVDQVAATLRAPLPRYARPGRIGIFKLRRQLDDLRASGRAGVVPIEVDGYGHPIWVRAGTSDLDVVQQLMTQHELGFELATDARWIIDLGANIGLSAIYFAHRFPRAQILAVEIDDGNYELLVRNCEPYSLITPIRKAVWCAGGRVRIVNPDAQPWSFRVEATTEADPEGIETVTINDLLSRFAISTVDLVKMDIEGAEREVLSEGLTPWLDQTRVLAVELHERHRPGCAAALGKALNGKRYQRSQRGEYEIVRLDIG